MTDFIYQDGALLPTVDPLDIKNLWEDGQTEWTKLESFGDSDAGYEMTVFEKNESSERVYVADVWDITARVMTVYLPHGLARLDFLARWVPVLDQLNARVDGDSYSTLDAALRRSSQDQGGVVVILADGGERYLEGRWEKTPDGLLQDQRAYRNGHTMQEFIPWTAILHLKVNGFDPIIKKRNEVEAAAV